MMSSCLHKMEDLASAPYLSIGQGCCLQSSFMLPDICMPNDAIAIKNGLISYLLALSIAEDALNEFISRRYKSFDALIGNNSCYISSYIIFAISQKSVVDDEFLLYIKQCLKQITIAKQVLIFKTDNLRKEISDNSLNEYLEKNDLLITLKSELIYLTMAYACTQSKIKNACEIEEINHEKLRETYIAKLGIEIGKKTTQKLIKHWQKILSIFNIRTLQVQSNTAQRDSRKSWEKYLQDERYILKDQRGRLCAPSLYTAALVYDKLMEMPGAVLGLQVNVIQFPKKYISKCNLYFEVQEDKKLKILTSDQFSSTQPIYMFTGCRYVSNASVNIEKIKEEFAMRNLRTLILAHEVTYPQYPKALKVNDIVPQEQELIRELDFFKQMQGFSIESPTDLCLVHMFVDNALTQSLHQDCPVYLPQLETVE